MVGRGQTRNGVKERRDAVAGPSNPTDEGELLKALFEAASFIPPEEPAKLSAEARRAAQRLKRESHRTHQHHPHRSNSAPPKFDKFIIYRTEGTQTPLHWMTMEQRIPRKRKVPRATTRRTTEAGFQIAPRVPQRAIERAAPEIPKRNPIPPPPQAAPEGAQDQQGHWRVAESRRNRNRRLRRERASHRGRNNSNFERIPARRPQMALRPPPPPEGRPPSHWRRQGPAHYRPQTAWPPLPPPPPPPPPPPTFWGNHRAPHPPPPRHTGVGRRHAPQRRHPPPLYGARPWEQNYHQAAPRERPLPPQRAQEAPPRQHPEQLPSTRVQSTRGPHHGTRFEMVWDQGKWWLL
ncbi:hypothetical protein J437_LFUL016122 [Ladona fulva]|uniref:Uncharacterized protein n=1 Tax=Ladona fulva TaxID=123851 RepID=A0A8K0P4N9_LADFU|nr:hypothetical protein J437_LFUL016122 [Ladona fulva]